MFPIGKNKNVEFNSKEILYNEIFSSFRSKIEVSFGILGNKLKRFNNKDSIKVIDIKIYIKSNYLLWLNENYDYPNPYKED